MAITFQKSVRIGDTTIVTVTSSLTGTVYFHWYVDGVYVGVTTSGTKSLFLPVGGMARIEVVDTNSAAFNPLAAPPAFYPAKYTLHWVRSLATDVAEYLVEVDKNGAGWVTLARVPHSDSQWDYQVLSERLDDLSNYNFRVSAIDAVGNAGSPIQTSVPFLIVRVPDSPRWSFTWDSGTQRITYAAA
jgi:hypothetical protein